MSEVNVWPGNCSAAVRQTGNSHSVWLAFPHKSHWQKFSFSSVVASWYHVAFRCWGLNSVFKRRRGWKVWCECVCDWEGMDVATVTCDCQCIGCLLCEVLCCNKWPCCRTSCGLHIIQNDHLLMSLYSMCGGKWTFQYWNYLKKA